MTRRPTYAQMCAEAISSLAQRGGSSQKAITKFLESRYGAALPPIPHFRRRLSIRLKRLVNHSLLVKNKASYKLTRSARRRLLVRLSKSRRQQQAVAPPASAPPALVVLPLESHGASANIAALSEFRGEDGQSDTIQRVHLYGMADLQMHTTTTSNIAGTSSGQSSPSSSDYNSATSSLSPRKRRRALLKQLLISLRSVDPVLHTTYTPACMRRRLRRYGASLLRPI